MYSCKPRATLATIIAMAAVCVSCSDVPATNPTAPTRPTPQQSALAPVLSAQIEPAIDTMRIGERLSFSIKLELGEGVPPSGPIPHWSSTNPAVIIIDPSGNATAVGTGEAAIEVIGRVPEKLTRNIQVTP